MAGNAAFSGEFTKLVRWAQKFEQAPKAMKAAAENMAEEGLGLIAEGFKSGTDPYGKPWNAPNDLQIKGHIRRYARKLTANGFRLFATDKKAIWHHDPRPRKKWGGKALPTRLQVPTAEKGIPRRWAPRLEEAATEAMRSHFQTDK